MNVIAHAVRVTRGCVAPRPRLGKAQWRLALAASVLDGASGAGIAIAARGGAGFETPRTSPHPSQGDDHDPADGFRARPRA